MRSTESSQLSVSHVRSSIWSSGRMLKLPGKLLGGNQFFSLRIFGSVTGKQFMRDTAFVIPNSNKGMRLSHLAGPCLRNMVVINRK